MYLAGHGVSHGEEYFFLTQEAQSPEMADSAPEKTKPVRQSVSFLLRSAADPLLDVIVVDSCGSAPALLRRDDDAVIIPNLDPGTYYVIVDGRNAARGSFELVSFCGPPTLEPATLSRTASAGSCRRRTPRPAGSASPVRRPTTSGT